MIGNGKTKRIEDLVVAILLLILLSPCLLLIALVIRLESVGPALFVQLRRGENDSVFRLYKFRTMFTHAEDTNCIVQCEKDDLRLTPVGAFLRRHSLDELPQLLNVLLGQMSIVGPRPHALGTNIKGQMLNEVFEKYCARYVVKPGITGWAQVNGLRGNLQTLEDLKDRVAYDLYYIANWSVWFDVKIMLLTGVRILKDDAAY